MNTEIPAGERQGHTAETLAKKPAQTRRRPWLVFICVTFVLLYSAGIILQANSGVTKTSTPDFEQLQQNPNAVGVAFTFTGIQNTDGTATAFITVIPGENMPKENIADGIKTEFTRDIELQMDPLIGNSSLRFKPGDKVSETRVQFNFDGAARNWPFDRFEAIISASAKSNNQDIPVAMYIDSKIPSWKLTSREATQEERENSFTLDPQTTAYKVTVAREGSTLLFAVMILLVLITLPIIALFVASRVYSGKQKFQPAFMAWFTTMLFAVVPLRGFLPGNPPPGSWVDVLITLWVIIGLVLALVIYISAWIKLEKTPSSSTN